MKKHAITLVPIGGLCNRMRAVASTVYVARKLNCPISVYWNKNSECFADFSDLFCPVSLCDISFEPYPTHTFHLEFARKRNLFLPHLLRTFLFDKQLIGSTCLADNELSKLRGRIFIISGGFVADCYSFTELFVPTDEIQKQINELKAQFSEHIYGIHIRRTDNTKSIENNGLEDYLRFMEQKIETNPDAQFYLATDSKDAKELFIDRYGKRILFHKAVLERTSLQGIKDAVIDLWCLSLTKEIIGSFHSSYSETAAELGSIPLKILK